MRDYIDIVEAATPSKIHRMTSEEARIIRVAAQKAVTPRVARIEVGIRENSHGQSVNLLLISPDGIVGDTELSDFASWDQIRKGFPLTDDGDALLDFYVYSREELQDNVTGVWHNGELVAVVGTTENILWEKPGARDADLSNPEAE